MRARDIAPVFGRKLASGKVVFYYQFYDKNGIRRSRSTGLTRKTEAKKYAVTLWKNGALIPKPAEKTVPTFSEFSKGWWVPETCQYLKWRQLTNPLSINSIDTYRANFNKHLKEYFASYRMDEITEEVLQAWQLDMAGKGLKASTINIAYKTLKLMLDEAARLKIIKANPAKLVKKLKEGKVKRIILTVSEQENLFPENWQTVWDSYTSYMASRIASITAMRIGELRGLRGKDIFPDYLVVDGQYTRHGYSEVTKTKESRTVPISPAIYALFKELIKRNGKGFLFSEDGGKTPIRSEIIEKQFNAAINKIGISEEERVRRNLTFHSWRHFFNTRLLTENVAKSKVQSVTGHKTDQMTDHYTEFDNREFKEICEVQDKLLNTVKPETAV